MDIKFTNEQEQYREKAKEWLKKNVPHDWKKKLSDYDELAKIQIDWDRKLYEGGFAGISWPKEYGGQGLTMVEEIIFNEEMRKAGAPDGINAIGKGLLGPTLLALGTEEQKQRYIQPLLATEEIWCQGYSEPNAGSDLASLKTQAVLDGDEWVINGQKVWTSYAQHAHWCFVLARTDINTPKHKGITYFLVPMNTEGITVKPIKQMNRKKKFSEVFFENVRIPKDSIVGEVNDGWNVAMKTLSFERGTVILARQAEFIKEYYDLIRLSEELRISETGDNVLDNSYFRQKLAKAYMEFTILRYHGLNMISQIMNDGKLGPEASIQKLFYSEAHQKFSELAMEIQSHLATYWGESGLAQGIFQQIYLDTRGETIYAGTSQIQKNIIAERILGMPR